MSRIESVGAYAPGLRVSAEEIREAWGHFRSSGITEKAVADADEDALTMAYEAAKRALDAAGREGSDVDFLAFASTTPPLAEGDLTPRLGEFLGVPGDAEHHTFTGSTRAGTRALGTGLARDGVGLVVAADSPKGEPNSAEEHAAGAGAAAFVLSPDGSVELVDSASYAADYPGTRFRNRGSRTTESLDITQYERNAFSETLAGAVGQLEADVSEVDAAAVQSPDGKLPYRVAGALGVSTEEIQACATVHDLGDTGTASVPLSLARALADGYESVLAVSQGSGAGADAFVVEVDGDVPAATALEGDDPLSYAEYLRQRGVVTTGPPSGGGAYVSVPSWRRSLPQRYRLEAGRCSECGALSFPPEGACDDCGALAEYEPVELAGEGTIEAVTTISQGGAPPEFAEQQARSGDYAAAIVALETDDGDETVSAPAMGTDADPADFAVGDRIETTIRRIYTQEGVTRYGFKVRPASE